MKIDISFDHARLLQDYFGKTVSTTDGYRGIRYPDVSNLKKLPRFHMIQ